MLVLSSSEFDPTETLGLSVLRPASAISHSPFGRKVLGLAIAQGMFSAGSNAAPRVHHSYRRCGGLLAAGGASTAARSNAAAWRPDGGRRKRCRCSKGHRYISAKASRARLEGWPQYPDRLSLRWWGCRANSNLREGVIRPATRRSDRSLYSFGQGASETDQRDTNRFPHRHGPIGPGPGRKPLAPRRKHYRFLGI
jgi:hypothetical protein